MKITCKTNNENILPKELSGIAYTQDEVTGIADITPGKSYAVYGARTGGALLGDSFEYLIVTDTRPLPWWMSSYFFKDLTGEIPKTWSTKQYEFKSLKSDVKLEITAPPSYHDAYLSGGEEQIVEGDPEGFDLFEKIKAETGY